ncbi:MAG: hypothetical protein AAFV26_08025 [Pseudomonadota bacterium]
MSEVALDRRRKSDAVAAEVRRGMKFDALAPLLLGFISPLIVIALLDPAVFREARGVIVASLILVMVVAAIAFTYGVLVPKAITGIRFDPSERAAILTSSNFFAEEQEMISFRNILDLREVKGYDRDGYQEAHSEIVTRNGDRVVLPFELPRAQLNDARRLLGVA